MHCNGFNSWTVTVPEYSSATRPETGSPCPLDQGPATACDHPCLNHRVAYPTQCGASTIELHIQHNAVPQPSSCGASTIELHIQHNAVPQPSSCISNTMRCLNHRVAYPTQCGASTIELHIQHNAVPQTIELHIQHNAVPQPSSCISNTMRCLNHRVAYPTQCGASTIELHIQHNAVPQPSSCISNTMRVKSSSSSRAGLPVHSASLSSR